MSLFVCSKCKCIENTALCGYWYRKGKPLCSKCDPQFGKWHGCFKREKFNSKKWRYYEKEFVEKIKNYN